MPTSSPITLSHLLTALALLFSGFMAWLALDSRVTRLETTTLNAELAIVPVKIERLEGLARTNAERLQRIEAAVIDGRRADDRERSK